MLFRSLLVLLTCLLLSACKSTKDTSSATSLRNTRWVLRTLADTPITTPKNSQEIYLQFDATTDQIAGHSGCNRYFGRFEQPIATTLHFLNIGSTRMFCETRQQLEIDYLKALQETSRFKIEGNTLRLYAGSGDEPVAIFEAVHL